MSQMTETEALELFDRALNCDEEDGTIKILGGEYTRSYAFKNIDPIAYRGAFLDWCDAMGIDFE